MFSPVFKAYFKTKYTELEKFESTEYEFETSLLAKIPIQGTYKQEQNISIPL